MPLPKQRKVIELFANLFASGFHLAEIIDFLKRSKLLEAPYTDIMENGLLAGKPFSAILSDLSFSDNITTQLSLAESHGNMERSLQRLQTYLDNLLTARKKLLEVATYPFILVGFLIAIMLGLKHYLLPQMTEGNLATSLINHLPTIFFTGLAVVIGLVLILLAWYRKSSKIAVFTCLARLPFIGSLTQTYLTAYYAREWGSLIGQGLEMTQILMIMQDQPSQLFRELGHDLLNALSSGEEFHHQITRYPFFRKELSLIIEYGQVKAKLGHELDIYAKECWETFFSSLHQAMQLIQPLVFLFVALMIVLIYAAMLLPIYHNMEVTI